MAMQDMRNSVELDHCCLSAGRAAISSLLLDSSLASLLSDFLKKYKISGKIVLGNFILTKWLAGLLSVKLSG